MANHKKVPIFTMGVNFSVRSDRVKLYETLKLLQTKEKVLRVTVEPWSEKRSGAANRWYWAILNNAWQHTGHLPETWHLYFKTAFLGETVVIVPNEADVVIPGSTADMEQEEFIQYVEKIQMFLWEKFDIIALDPSDYFKQKFHPDEK